MDLAQKQSKATCKTVRSYLSSNAFRGVESCFSFKGMIYWRHMIEYNKKQLTRIALKYKLKFVILHGSYATGRSHKGSDLDIAVLAKKELGFKQMLKLYGELADIFGDNTRRELDMKTLNRVDSLFRYEVTRDGVLLYGDPTDYEEYKAVSYRMYEDAKPLRDLEMILIRNIKNI